MDHLLALLSDPVFLAVFAGNLSWAVLFVGCAALLRFARRRPWRRAPRFPAAPRAPLFRPEGLDEPREEKIRSSESIEVYRVGHGELGYCGPLATSDFDDAERIVQNTWGGGRYRLERGHASVTVFLEGEPKPIQRPRSSDASDFWADQRKQGRA